MPSKETINHWIAVATRKEKGGPYDMQFCRDSLMMSFCHQCLETMLDRKIKYEGYSCLTYLGEGVCEACGEIKPMIKEMTWEEYHRRLSI